MATIGTVTIPNAVTINRAKTIEVSGPTEPCGTISVIAMTSVWIVFGRLIRSWHLLQYTQLTTADCEQQIPPDLKAQTSDSTYQNTAGAEGEEDYGDMLSPNGDVGRRA